jgi:putative transcriptional regulator
MRNRLKELRARYNMTQEDLANKVGVSRQTIVAIEKEKYDPSLPLAFKLAKCFGVRVEELFELEEDDARI